MLNRTDGSEVHLSHRRIAKRGRSSQVSESQIEASSRLARRAREQIKGAGRILAFEIGVIAAFVGSNWSWSRRYTDNCSWKWMNEVAIHDALFELRRLMILCGGARATIEGNATPPETSKQMRHRSLAAFLYLYIIFQFEFPTTRQSSRLVISTCTTPSILNPS